VSFSKRTYYHKAKLQNRFVLELNIHYISDSKQYPDNIKYRLICYDTKNRRKILFDNHAPKGHHLHIDENEFPYVFVDENQLIDDFQKHVLDHFGVRL